MDRWQLRALVVLATWFGSSARAEPVQPSGVVPVLSASDGSVRAEAGMRVEVTRAAGSVGDHALAMGQRVSKRMPVLRACYQQALQRRSGLAGKVTVRLEHARKAAQKVRLKDNGTGDPALGRCLTRALAHTRLAGLPSGAAARVTLHMDAPGHVDSREMSARTAAARKVQIEPGPNGRLSSRGGTQGGEVEFSLESEREDREALEALHHDVADRLAGLLDCRRRATRRGNTPQGTFVFMVHTEPRGVQRVVPLRNPSRNPKASECVGAWLRRGGAADLREGQVRLSLSYGP